jgi:hypothetical protein
MERMMEKNLKIEELRRRGSKEDNVSGGIVDENGGNKDRATADEVMDKAGDEIIFDEDEGSEKVRKRARMTKAKVHETYLRPPS